MKQYIVDAFTAVPGVGNPAAVCVMAAWPDDEAMQALAKENGLSVICTQFPGHIDL